MVDILSSEGHLNAMSAMEMSQMIVQGMWDRDSPLKQIPHFSPEVVKVANEFGYVLSDKLLGPSANVVRRIKDIFDFMEAMNPDENADYNKLVKRLGLSQNQLAQAANFTNDKYPDLELEHEVLDEGEIRAGEPAYLNIKIARNLEEEDGDYDSTVHAPFYPSKKMENWWLVVGDEKTKSLLAIKRVTIGRELNVRLEYTVPSPGEHDLKLFLMSDSYVGVDQEREFSVTAAEGMDVDDDEEDEDEDEDEE
jgi:pre-mRNA-splicing helicase BRR2